MKSVSSLVYISEHETEFRITRHDVTQSYAGNEKLFWIDSISKDWLSES